MVGHKMVIPSSGSFLPSPDMPGSRSGFLSWTFLAHIYSSQSTPMINIWLVEDEPIFEEFSHMYTVQMYRKL
jgi:hypothetical protein